MKNYRKELKYFVTEGQLFDIENRIKGLLKPDEHQNGDYYLIRSIYFDDPFDSCLRENEAGVGRREKYRIRTYDAGDKRISAEIKIRYRDTISKQSALITRDELDAMVAVDREEIGRFLGNANTADTGKVIDASGVRGKYLMKLIGEAYSPKVIVEYKRSAYVYGPANVRITFDRDVTASRDFNSFFSESIHGIPIMDKGIQILEIKYDEFLPDEVAMLLGGLNLERTSCSKYYLCREKLKEFIG